MRSLLFLRLGGVEKPNCVRLSVGQLDRQDRQKIMTVCTIDVHSRDIVFKLIQEKGIYICLSPIWYLQRIAVSVCLSVCSRSCLVLLVAVAAAPPVGRRCAGLLCQHRRRAVQIRLRVPGQRTASGYYTAHGSLLYAACCCCGCCCCLLLLFVVGA